MAGFFGFFDYSKPGKGVRKDEPKRSHFVTFFILTQRKFWKLIQLNLLFVVFCVPALAVAYMYLSGTIASPFIAVPLFLAALLLVGPAIAGMAYVLRNFANERPVFLFSDFWDSFRTNFKQSAICGYMIAGAVFIIAISGSFYWENTSIHAWMYIPAGFIFLVSILFIFSNFYIFPMIVTLELPLKAILKNGLLLAILCMKSNFITLLFIGLIAFALWLFPVIGFIVYLVIGFALMGFIIMHNAYRGIQKYAIDPYIASLENENEEDGERVFDDESIIPRTED